MALNIANSNLHSTSLLDEINGYSVEIIHINGKAVRTLTSAGCAKMGYTALKNAELLSGDEKSESYWLDSASYWFRQAQRARNKGY